MRMPASAQIIDLKFAKLLRDPESSIGPSPSTAMHQLRKNLVASPNFQSSYTFHGHITTYFWVDSYYDKNGAFGISKNKCVIRGT